MLVGSNNGNFPARNPGKISNLVQEDTLHTSGVVCGMGAIDEFHRFFKLLMLFQILGAYQFLRLYLLVSSKIKHIQQISLWKP